MTDANSDVERVFARLAESLDISVLAHVHDHYAKMQLRAAREMLLNLGSRVEWRRRDIEADEKTLKSALQSLRADLPSSVAETDATASATDLAHLDALRRDLASIIERIYEPEWDGTRRERALTEIFRVIRFEFDAEAERIKTGMFT